MDEFNRREEESNASFCLLRSAFDNHAMAIIDRCFDIDENFAVDIVKRQAYAFNDIEPLKFAQKSNCRSFLASKCVQRHLDNIWSVTIRCR